MDPFDILMQEHRHLEHLLEALEQCVEPEGSAPIADIAAFVEVFASIDTMQHQVKEERLLLPALRSQGDPAHGRLFLLQEEHAQQRELLRQLAEAAGMGDQVRIAELACAYADAARCHIFTEETIVFPMARERLMDPQLVELAESFQRFDREAVEALSALRARADELANRYAPRPECIEPRVQWAGVED